jgi:membrane-associated phospholipid phosphatase
MQHFLMDVWAGALLGIFSSLVSYFLVLKFFSKKRYQNSIFQKLKGKPSI